MKIVGAWLNHPGTQGVFRAFERAGAAAYLVGGCVRNALLGRPVEDIDIATPATPENVTNIAENAGFRVVPTGLSHGTVTIIADGLPHEVTTFRRDLRTDGRHAEVAFSTRIEDDAARRDFTMNALYATAAGEVIDPLGGLDDLKAGRLRFVGEAEARIREDYLRILRFFRFHAHYADPEGGFDPEGLAACAANSAGLETLSRERIGAEMRKLLLAPDPAPAVSTMAVCGILAPVLPGADTRAFAPYLHHAGDVGLAPDAIARLAALGGEEAANALRLSRAEARTLTQLREAATGTMGAAELGYRLGADQAAHALCLRAALMEAPLAGIEAARAGAGATFPLRAADFPDLTGPALGAALRAAEARWIASGFGLSREQLLG